MTQQELDGLKPGDIIEWYYELPSLLGSPATGPRLIHCYMRLNLMIPKSDVRDNQYMFTVLFDVSTDGLEASVGSAQMLERYRVMAHCKTIGRLDD